MYLWVAALRPVEALQMYVMYVITEEPVDFLFASVITNSAVLTNVQVLRCAVLSVQQRRRAADIQHILLVKTQRRLWDVSD